MAIPIPRPPAAATRIDSMHQAQQREGEARATVWAFLWTLFAFKMATVLVIYWAARSSEAGALLFATTWFWMVIPIAAISGPLLFRYRLMKVRSRRERLQRAEWLVEDSE